MVAILVPAIVALGQLARADVNNSSGTNVQDGDNWGSTTQNGHGGTGDAVGGQVTGVVSSGRTSIDARNSSTDSSASSGDVKADNKSASFTGLNSVLRGTNIGTSDVSGVPFAVNVQDGNDRLTVTQTADAVTGDAVAGQVIGAVSSGNTSIVAANTTNDSDVQTGDASANNDHAAFVGLVTAGNAAIATVDVLNVGSAVNVQDGDDRATSRQAARSSTGDGVAGQVIGAVSSGATSIDARNTSTNSDVETGDADTSNAFAGSAGLSASGSLRVGVSDVTGVHSAVNVQSGTDRITSSQTASATSGDGVAGEVIGAVVSGSASIVAANTSDNDDVTTGKADATNAGSAFVGLSSTGSTGIGGSDVSGIGSGVNVQDGNNRLSSTQSASANTGDGVAGQVIGAVSSGATSIDARNTSTDDSVDTGDSHASNDLSAFVGLDVSGNTSIADVSGVGAAVNIQDGTNNAARTQTADATSGDGIAGQVVGGVVSGGASIVTANTSENIDSTTGNTDFSNDDDVFVGQASNLSTITI